MAPRKSRAGKGLSAGLLEFCTSRSGLSAMKLLALECFTPVKPFQCCWHPECVRPGRNCCHSMTPPLMPREGVSHGVLLGFEKCDQSLLASSKGETSAFQGCSCCFSIMCLLFSPSPACAVQKRYAASPYSDEIVMEVASAKQQDEPEMLWVMGPVLAVILIIIIVIAILLFKR